MSFEYYYITVVSLVIFVVALLIGLIMNNRYYKAISEALMQVKEVESKGPPTMTSGDFEVLMCPPVVVIPRQYRIGWGLCW